MSAFPLDDSLPESCIWTSPRQAADAVILKCQQKHGFQSEQDFWDEFSHIYAEAETTVRPEQRLAFTTEVDGHLVRMGLAAWSIVREGLINMR